MAKKKAVAKSVIELGAGLTGASGSEVAPETDKGVIESYGLNPKAGTSHLTQGPAEGGEVPPETDKS